MNGPTRKIRWSWRTTTRNGESETDTYYICIHGKVIFKNEFEAIYIDEEDISVFDLVYDSAEHEDYSLIDENLVVPDVHNGIGFNTDSFGWSPIDVSDYCGALFNQYSYHSERTA